jgi:hypothetical protein
VEEYQRIHEHSQARGLHQNIGGGQNRELQLTALELIEFSAIQRTHMVSPTMIWPVASLHNGREVLW